MENIKIIAESASNHNGKYEDLLLMAKKSKLAGANYFTCQICDADYFCDRSYPSFELVKNICLTRSKWKEFFKECKKLKINLIPCPTEISSLDFCIKEGFKLIKVHGTDILNIPFLKRISKSKVLVILETQFATERDIELAISILGIKKISCLFHGYSNYPTEAEETNLNAISFMKNKWQIDIGFADHSTETKTLPLLAIAKGATWIEKHISLSRNDRNYDWETSIEYEDFSKLILNIKKYIKTFGKNYKHPTKNERKIRDLAFKKYIKKNKKVQILRSNKGDTYYNYEYSKNKKENIIATVCGRLTSTRLKNKLFLDLLDDKLIFQTFDIIKSSRYLKKHILATSYEKIDDDLANEAEDRKINIYRGSGENLIDRLLDIAESNKASAILKITGDSPFALPDIIDTMCKLYLKDNLDYVRTLNVPQGLSPELISTKYLQEIYQKIENPYQSEYLGYFVLLDKNAKKGAVHLKYNGQDLTKYKLSIDLKDDMKISQNLIKKIGKNKFADITLKDVITNLTYIKKIPKNTQLKMPNNEVINYYKYIEMLNNQKFFSSTELIIK